MLRVVRKYGSNQGYLEEHGRETLYVGRDLEEAELVYEKSAANDNPGHPGTSYSITIAEEKQDGRWVEVAL